MSAHACMRPDMDSNNACLDGSILAKKTVKELRKMAKSMGLSRYSKLNKAPLIEYLITGVYPVTGSVSKPTGETIGKPIGLPISKPTTKPISKRTRRPKLLQPDDNVQPLFFYSDRADYGAFSNFYKVTIKVYERTFKHSEGAFMYAKALTFKDKKIAEQILKADKPRDAKSLGRKSKFDEHVWKNVREDIMFECCYAKFSQNKKLKKLLLSTGDRMLVEASPRDRIWGIGYSVKRAPFVAPSKWGKNLLGHVLMRVRQHLQSVNQ